MEDKKLQAALEAWQQLQPLTEDAEVGSVKVFSAHFEAAASYGNCGDVLTDGRGYLGVRCADGVVYIDELQLAGKRRMTIKELLLGWRDASEVSFT